MENANVAPGRWMVESRGGDLWLNAARGIVHVRANELRAALSEPRHAMQSELVAESDFVGPSPGWWPSATCRSRRRRETCGLRG